MSAVEHRPCALCGERVLLLPRGWKAGDSIYCEQHAELADCDPLVHGPRDIDRAIAELSRDASCLVEWPWHSLNEMTGPIAPGTVSYVGAFPKGGKSSFLAECIDFWWQGGKRVFVMPLEARKWELHTRLACLRLGIDPDYALSKRMHLAVADGDPHARLERDQLVAEFMRLKADESQLERLWLHGAPMVTVPLLKRAMRQAANAGADVFLVDHVDHVEADAANHQSELQVSFAAQMAAHVGSQEFDLPVVLATQLNLRSVRNDKLALFRAPVVDWLWMPGKKQQVATRILGLYRPQRPDVTESQRLDVMQGLKGPSAIAHLGRMGVVDMASRYGGSRVQPTLQLSFVGGRLTDLTRAELLNDDAIRHGISTDNSPSLYIGEPAQRRGRPPLGIAS